MAGDATARVHVLAVTLLLGTRCRFLVELAGWAGHAILHMRQPSVVEEAENFIPISFDNPLNLTYKLLVLAFFDCSSKKLSPTFITDIMAFAVAVCDSGFFIPLSIFIFCFLLRYWYPIVSRVILCCKSLL